jgi:FlaA1/EpsC-like NDP-sugar epimerase
VPTVSFGRGALVLAVGCAVLTLVVARLFVLRAIDFNPIKRRVLVIGAGEAALKVRRLRRRADRRRFDVVGFVALSDLERRQAVQLGIEPIVTVDEAPAIAAAGVDEVVVAVEDRRGSLPLEFLLQAKQIGVHVSELVDFLERETECLDLDILRPSWLLYEKSSQTDVLYRWLKRCFDLVFSVVLLVLLAPALLLTALAILVEDGPSLPLLYRQERVGRAAQVPQHARRCRA